MTERKYGIDSGWIVSETTACTCGMGRGSVYGHEAFCGLEQEAPVEEFDGWVKHIVADAYERGHRDERVLMSDDVERALAAVSSAYAKGRADAEDDCEHHTHDAYALGRAEEQAERMADSENGVGHWMHCPHCGYRHNITWAYNCGRHDERARIREAVQAYYGSTDPIGGYGFDEAIQEVLSLIGES